MLSNRPVILLGRFFDGLCGGRALILNLALALSATAPFPGKADSPDLLFKDVKAAATRDARDAEVAVLEPSGISAEQAPSLPQPLSAEDESRYRRIFIHQKTGEWKAADRLIRQLNNRILMGHVLYQRYMHPTKYRSKYKELRDWMALYADHPGARKIYNLALKRRPENYKYPKQPVGGYFYGRGTDPGAQMESVYVSKRKRRIKGPWWRP